MSQCNFRRVTFDCEAANDVKSEIRRCLVAIGRFHKRLTKFSSNATLKCFNPIPVDPYLEYMGQFLQRKRIEATYFHRATNDKRQKDMECIFWKNNTQVADRVLELLLEIDYYSFCQECMGSDNDLLRNWVAGSGTLL
jgi:hypothetical protein